MTMSDLASVGILSADQAVSEKDMDLAAKKDIDKILAGTRIYSSSLAGWAELRDMPVGVRESLVAASTGNSLSADEKAELKAWSDAFFKKYSMMTQAGNWLTANLPGLITQYVKPPTDAAPAAPAVTAEDILKAQQDAAAAQKRKMINIAALAGGGAVVIGLVVWMVSKGRK
jgi:hypothetical protein